MTSYIDGEISIFLWSVLSGAIILFLYDILSLITNKESLSIFVCNFFDGIFLICACTIMIFILLNVSNGYIRGYEFLGVFIGGILYKFTLSSFVKMIFSKILSYIFTIFKFFLKILLTPITFMYKIMYNSISMLFKFGCKLFFPISLRLKRFFALIGISLKKT